MKSFLEIRPINHRKPDGIKVHVLICVLSLNLSGIIEKITNAMVSHVADILSELKAVPVRIPGGKTDSHIRVRKRRQDVILSQYIFNEKATW